MFAPIKPKSKRVSPSVVPPLQPGDRLTRAEFERRYDATPNLKYAELIEGVVYIPPPVSIDGHSEPHFDVVTLLGTYRLSTPGVGGGDNGSLRMDLENMPQPDAYLRVLETHGGRSRIDADGYLAGPPELIVEVAATSASYDLHDKLAVYRRNGVAEYVVWRVLDGAVDYFVLRDGVYAPPAPGPHGVLRSEVFPGLWLDPAALVDRDMARAVAVLRKGLASRAHAAFVSGLKKVAKPRR